MKHLLQVLAIVALFLTGYTAKAQMSYGGEPYSFKNTISQVVPTIEIEALDAEALLAEDAEKTDKGHALRIGVTKDVNYTISNSGRMDILPDGARVWRLAFHMEDATFVSMYFSTFSIPDGAELFFYTPDREFVIGKFTNKNQMEDGSFYPQDIPGDEVVVEYYEPANVAFEGRLTISEISQGYYDFFHIKSIEGSIGSAEGNCHPNAICYDQVWHENPNDGMWRQQINSVVCYTMSSGGYIYMCSGAMINNTANNFEPYLLTANHCYEGTPSTWKFYFKYQATSCTGTNGTTLKNATGATVLARDNGDSSSDFMLLKITGTINASSFDIFFAGWDLSTSAPATPTSCGAIHHPGGDIKKFSVPQHINNGSSYGYPKFWAVNWAAATGATEGGSSGSPLFNKKGLIVGQLYAGSSSCSYPSGYDYYGKISNSWTNNNNSSNAKKLKPWLDPNNTINDNNLSLQGRWMPGAPSGISSYETASDLRAFPNPSNGMITISGNYNEGNGICNVYDMMGNLVISKSVSLNTETTLNLVSLSPGMYLLEVSENNNVYRSKILISK